MSVTPSQFNKDFIPKRPDFTPQFPPPPHPKTSKKPLWFGLGGMGIGFVLGAGIVGAIVGINAAVDNGRESAKAGLIADAYASCSLEDVDGATLSSDEMSITISGAGEYYGPDIADIYCLGESLGMPDSVTSRMGQTRALDGTQSAEWDSFSASWNYHPDDSLGVVFEYIPTTN